MENKKPLQRSILLVGCGDIGSRLAKQLTGQNWTCTGLRRHPEQLPDFITPLKADLNEPDTLACLANKSFDYIVVTLTPAAFTEEAYRRAYIEGSKHLLQALDKNQITPKHFFWISSTSVFSETEGNWVNEDSATHAPGFSGRCLREAEQVIEQSLIPSTLVRFAGIYGPDRKRLINQVLAGQGCPVSPEQWTNRIHIDDCANVLAHLMQLRETGQALEPIYLACDSNPSTMYDVKQWLAAELSVEGLNNDHPPKMPGNRRCSNQKLLGTGYQFIYPDFRSGYRAILGN